MEFISPLNPREGDPPGIYHNGNPSAGQEGSIPPAEIFENPQQEIMNVISSAGVVPDGNNMGQLWEAIVNTINAMAPSLSADALYLPAVFAGGVADGNVVYFNNANSNYDLALGGTDIPVGIADVTNNNVYISGKLPTGLLSGLTVGTYYLSDSVPGDITVTLPAADPMEIGSAISADVLNVDIEAAFSRLATSSVEGLIKLASDAEASAGTDTESAITAARLKNVLDNRTADTSSTGLVKFVSNVDILGNAEATLTLAVSVAALKSLKAAAGLAGVVELASNSTTQTGSSSTTAVTPAGLKSLTATTTRRGLVELADDTEAKAGTSTTLAITPSGLKAAIDLAVANHTHTVNHIHSSGGSDPVDNGGP